MQLPGCASPDIRDSSCRNVKIRVEYLIDCWRFTDLSLVFLGEKIKKNSAYQDSGKFRIRDWRIDRPNLLATNDRNVRSFESEGRRNLILPLDQIHSPIDRIPPPSIPFSAEIDSNLSISSVARRGEGEQLTEPKPRRSVVARCGLILARFPT